MAHADIRQVHLTEEDDFVYVYLEDGTEIRLWGNGEYEVNNLDGDMVYNSKF